MRDESALETIDNSFQIGRNYPMIHALVEFIFINIVLFYCVNLLICAKY